MKRVSEAFDSMIRQIEEGKEFPCAHANVLGRFALTDKQSLEVIAMYDSLCSETKSDCFNRTSTIERKARKVYGQKIK